MIRMGTIGGSLLGSRMKNPTSSPYVQGLNKDTRADVEALPRKGAAALYHNLLYTARQFVHAPCNIQTGGIPNYGLRFLFTNLI